MARDLAAQNCSMEFSAMVAAFSAVVSAAITRFSHGLLHLAMVKTATARARGHSLCSLKIAGKKYFTLRLSAHSFLILDSCGIATDEGK